MPTETRLTFTPYQRRCFANAVVYGVSIGAGKENVQSGTYGHRMGCYWDAIDQVLLRLLGLIVQTAMLID